MGQRNSREWLASNAAPVVIAETVLASAATEIDWPSIPGSSRHLMVLLQGRSDTAATTAFVRCQFNGDTGLNYYSQRVFGNNTSAGGSANVGEASGIVGLTTAASATAGHAGTTTIHIPNYVGTTFNKGCNCQINYFTGTAAANAVVEARSMMWASTSAITRIRLFPSAGNFIAGTTATLFGLGGG